VLQAFRLTIDYPNRVLYLLPQRPADVNDLNQVGLTLEMQNGEYRIAGVATKDGKATVAGVSPGDKLLRIGNLSTKDATWGQIYSALHGKPGESRTLILQRGAERPFSVQAKITMF